MLNRILFVEHINNNAAPIKPRQANPVTALRHGCGHRLLWGAVAMLHCINKLRVICRC